MHVHACASQGAVLYSTRPNNMVAGYMAGGLHARSHGKLVERAASPIVLNAEQQPVNVPDQAQFWSSPDKVEAIEVESEGEEKDAPQQASPTAASTAGTNSSLQGNPSLMKSRQAHAPKPPPPAGRGQPYPAKQTEAEEVSLHAFAALGMSEADVGGRGGEHASMQTDMSMQMEETKEACAAKLQGQAEIGAEEVRMQATSTQATCPGLGMERQSHFGVKHARLGMERQSPFGVKFKAELILTCKTAGEEEVELETTQGCAGLALYSVCMYMARAVHC
eukprot:1160439-Pelagomonas_calceolata.AAC.6